MTEKHSRLAGSRFLILLIGLFVICAVWAAIQQPILLTENGPAVEATWPDMRIDINNANAAELSVLPGIGPALAERIVEDRKLNGEFQTLYDLDRVTGIGQKTIDRISEFAVANGN